MPPIAGEPKPATRGLYLGAIKEAKARGTRSLLGRRYTRAYAGQIVIPDGGVRVVLGAEDPKSPRRFAVDREFGR